MSRGTAEESFNTAFTNRFRDLSEMYPNPSSTTASESGGTLDSPNLQNLLAQLNAAKSTSGGSSGASADPLADHCSPCAALAKPLTDSAEPNKLLPGGASYWLMVVLLVVAMILIIFGLVRLFRRSGEGHHKYGAPHLRPDTPRPVQETEPVHVEVVTNHEDDPSDEPVTTIIFFHATWCGHCKELHKPFLELASMMKKDRQSTAKFKTMESEVMQKCAHSSRFNIDGFPSIVVYRNKTEIGRMVGNQGNDALLAFFTQHA